MEETQEANDQWDEQKSLQDIRDEQKLETLYPDQIEPKEEVKAEPKPDDRVESLYPSESQEISRPKPKETREPQTQQRNPVAETLALDPEASISMADLSALNDAHQASQQLAQAQNMLATYEQQIQDAGGLTELTGGDLDQVDLIQTDMNQIKEFIQAHTETLTNYAQDYVQRLQTSALEDARNQMYEKAPELRDETYREEFVQWALDEGFSVNEINAASESDVLRELKRFQKTKSPPQRKNYKVRKVRKKAVKKQPYKTEGQKMIERMYGVPKKPKPLVIPNNKESREYKLYGDTS